MLRSYENLLEAGFAQSLLESSGIAAVLEHEESTSLSPAGACQARLMVPDEQFTEAERIIAAHPTHFSGIVDDVPRFGFWPGSLLGVVAYLCVSGILLFASGSSHFHIVIMIFVWFIGGVVGANYQLRKKPTQDS